MFELLNNINIVLVETSHPGNIGAAARAMKTMGLSKLSLIRPAKYPCAEATARAASANDLLAEAGVFDSLDDALADCTYVVGTSARDRHLQWPNHEPDIAAQQLLLRAGQSQVALVFGREKWGLTNDELARCQAIVTINTSPAYSSLNLASAVQIMTYELRRQLLMGFEIPLETRSEPDDAPASSADLEGMYGHLEQALNDIGVIKINQPKTMLIRRLRRLFNRAGLSTIEVNILRGILSAAQGRKQVHRE
jgi:TrmH family RNA methyltransferase